MPFLKLFLLPHVFACATCVPFIILIITIMIILLLFIIIKYLFYRFSTGGLPQIAQAHQPAHANVTGIPRRNSNHKTF
jgi:hypothetical protein